MLSDTKLFVFDVETTGLDPFVRDTTVGAAFYLPNVDRSFYLPFQHKIRNPVWDSFEEALSGLNSDLKKMSKAKKWEEERHRLTVQIERIQKEQSWHLQWLPDPRNLPEHAWEVFFPIFSDRQKGMMAFNAPFDGHFVEQHIPLANQLFDVLILAHLFNENEVSHGLKALSDRYLGEDSSEEQAAMLNYAKQFLGARSAKRAYEHMALIPMDSVATYAEQDVRLTWRLSQFYIDQWKKDERFGPDLFRLWKEYNRWAEIIMRMEHHGLPTEPQAVRREIARCSAQADSLLEELKKYPRACGSFNPASVHDVRRLLYNQVEGPKESLPTDRYALLESDHPAAAKINEWRQLKKAENTYFVPFRDLADRTGRVHPSYRITGTVAGRGSCARPNATAIPRGGEKSFYNVKSVIVAPKGKTLLELDFSQIELRLAAHFAEDRRMIQAYQEGEDIHTLTARLITGAESPTDEQRTAAKAANFGFLYGMQAPKFVTYAYRSYGKAYSLQEATQFRSAFFQSYTRLEPFRFSIQRFAETYGYVRLWTGRVRRFQGPYPKYHTAFNNIVQGGAAELMRLAMTRLHDDMDSGKWKSLDPARFLLTVHDSCMFEVREEEAEEWYSIIKSYMEDFSFRVPIIAEGKIGPRWSEMRKVK
jgi:DNA polymerase-1